MKRSRQTIPWKLERCFENVDEEKNEFPRTKWTEIDSYDSKYGFTVKYRCKYYPNCQCLLMKRYCSDSMMVNMYNNQTEHNDSPKENKLPTEVMNRIYNTNKRISPYFFNEELKKENIILNRTQIYNYMYRKRKLENPVAMNVRDVNSWVSSKMNLPDERNMNEPFILHNESKGNDICFTITTRMMLKCINYGNSIHIDGTYKVNELSYPLLVAGVSNLSKSFFPSVYLITTGEATVDYKVLLNSLVKGCRLQNNCEIKIKWLMADAAEAITKSVNKVFGDSMERGYCFFHVMKNVKEK